MRSRDELVINAIAGMLPSPDGWVRGNCPWCELRVGREDKKKCLGLHIESGKWHCFRCGSAGLVQNLPDDVTSLVPEQGYAKERERVRIDLPEEFFSLYEEPGWSSQAGEYPREYLRARGVDDDLGFDAKIGACIRGKYGRRIVVPVYDVDGAELLGFSARAYFPDAYMRYLYPEGMLRGEILYNHAALFVETDEPALIVEGVFDALALWPDAVGCLGKPSHAQVEALLMSRRPLVAVLDGDAWREAEALSLRLRFEGLLAGYVKLPATYDPATVPAEVIRQKARDSLARWTPSQESVARLGGDPATVT